MWLFVGLGNPGAKYARHRHNLGFMAIDTIAETHGFDAWRSRFQGMAAEGRLSGQKVLLLKPTTFMNESGRAVGEATRFYKLAPENVVVFYDEIDLQPGKVRVKTGGGAAGHNGLKSVIAHLGEEFVRVRLGIGHPGRKDLVHHYVLHDFAKADNAWLEPLLDEVAGAAPRLAEGDQANFMNEVAAGMRRALEPAGKSAPSETRATGTAKTVSADKPGAETPATDSGPLAKKLRAWFGTRRED